MPHMVSPGKRNNVSANMRSFTCMSRSNESSELRNMPATISENGVTVPRLTPAKPLDDLYAVSGLGPIICTKASLASTMDRDLSATNTP